MNKKLIAAAVSAAVVAPVAAQADAEWYGRINTAIDMNDTNATAGVDGNTDISGVASRIGVRASSDLDNGMTAHGRYEFSTTVDKEGSGIGDTRIATVGLSGGWGRVDVGNQWSAYFNTFGTLVSPTYSLGYYLYSSVGGGIFRASNTIQYSNTFGPVTLYLDYRANGSDEQADVAEAANGDGTGIGVSFKITDNISIAAAVDSEGNNDVDTNQEVDRTGIAIKANFGNFWGVVGMQSYEDDGAGTVADETEIDTTYIWVGGSLGESTSWMVGSVSANDSESPDAATAANTSPATDDASQTTLGLYHNMGNGMRVYFESATVASQRYGADGNELDGSRHLFGMRYDF